MLDLFRPPLHPSALQLLYVVLLQCRAPTTPSSLRFTTVDLLPFPSYRPHPEWRPHFRAAQEQDHDVRTSKSNIYPRTCGPSLGMTSYGKNGKGSLESHFARLGSSPFIFSAVAPSPVVLGTRMSDTKQYRRRYLLFSCGYILTYAVRPTPKHV